MKRASILLFSREPAVILYQVICLASAAVVLFASQSAVARSFCSPLFLVALLSSLVLAASWLPPLVLFLFACTELTQPTPSADWLGKGEVLLDSRSWLLGCGLLGYVVSHYRLQSLRRSLLPGDLRLLGNSQAEDTAAEPGWPPRRLSADVTARELAGLVLGLPAWTALAQLLLCAMLLLPNVLDLPPRINQELWLIWLGGLAVLLLQLLLSLVRCWHLSAVQAQLILQDVLWRETRREQRRLQRWLAWDRLRRRPEEQP